MLQGVAVPFLIPNILSDERATIIGLALSSLQLLAYGFCPALWTFYVVLIMLSPGSLYGPALKALMAKTAVPEEQGALQVMYLLYLPPYCTYPLTVLTPLLYLL